MVSGDRREPEQGRPAGDHPASEPPIGSGSTRADARATIASVTARSCTYRSLVTAALPTADALVIAPAARTSSRKVFGRSARGDQAHSQPAVAWSAAHRSRPASSGDSRNARAAIPIHSSSFRARCASPGSPPTISASVGRWSWIVSASTKSSARMAPSRRATTQTSRTGVPRAQPVRLHSRSTADDVSWSRNRSRAIERCSWTVRGPRSTAVLTARGTSWASVAHSIRSSNASRSASSGPLTTRDAEASCLRIGVRDGPLGGACRQGLRQEHGP